ncbi:TetR/AcrR family transcriptional regulator [Sporosarcina cascadiensis]|uniref:TetR/AcrR family transcriptional regulator n=1 Tax=Sporosarcina cascadiensis TaxID=2660747 RepID=UPI00129BECD9|nr:TetR/AcrR family transcriptional regulator [Sporosarcina cascadiensis]
MPKSKDQKDYDTLIRSVSHELFEEHGVENVSMHQIAKKAAIGQATLYRRYANKGELCMAILSSDTAAFLHELDLFMEKSREEELPALDVLSGVIEKAAQYICSKAKILVIVKNEYGRNLLLLQYNHPVFMHLQEIIESIYVKAMNENEIIPIDVPLVTQLLIAALNPDLFLHKQSEEDFDEAAMIDGIKLLYVERLKK